MAQLNRKLDALLSVFDKEVKVFEIKEGDKVIKLTERFNSLTKETSYWDENGVEYWFVDGQFHKKIDEIN